MKITKNIGSIDRYSRIVLAEVFLLLAYFWTYGAIQIGLYVLAVVMLVTSLFKFCGLYTFIHINTCSSEDKKIKKSLLWFFIAMIVMIPFVGSYYSIFFTKKIFLEDYNRMNHYYKQTLFFTGQNNRGESVSNYTNLVTEYAIFYSKYSKYRPYVVAQDAQFVTDITSVKDKILLLENNVQIGDLSVAHKEFEIIRPIFQDILKRNGFSLLAVYLVDFHDAMEKVIAAADAKNALEIISVYKEVSDKLQAIEEIANDTEIQNIRQKLEQVTTSAKNNNLDVLPVQGGELKSSFVKVYLKRG